MNGLVQGSQPSFCGDGDMVEDETGMWKLVRELASETMTECASSCNRIMMSFDTSGCFDKDWKGAFCEPQCRERYMNLTRDCVNNETFDDDGKETNTLEWAHHMEGMCSDCHQSLYHIANMGCFEKGFDCNMAPC